MDKKVETEQQQGSIKLQPDSADAIRQVVQKVTQIVSEEDDTLTFIGERIIEGHGFNLEINCFDLYKCDNGYLLHTYMDHAPNWAVSGTTIKQTLYAAPDKRVAKRAHGLMVQKGLTSYHSH